MVELFGIALIAIVAIIITWIFDFVNGFHDSANSIATIVATKVLTPVKAVALAAFFNFFGIISTTAVAMTIMYGIIDPGIIDEFGIALIFAVLIGAIVWDLITWWMGIPSSSSHALVGGLIGAGVAAWGLDAIVWGGTLKTTAFIAIAPIAGMIIGFFIVSAVINLLRKSKRTKTNKWFRSLQIVSSAFYSYTHGTNDAQKGMGIIMLILLGVGITSEGDRVFLWVAVSCHAAIALGTFLGGWRIVKTMASRITKLEPYQGFSAETGAASMLLVTATMGIPVSTTHTISGSIMGVGASRRLSAVRWGVGRRLIIAWILTIPAAATISGLLFLLYVKFFIPV